jgi:hypothetical protein
MRAINLRYGCALAFNAKLCMRFATTDGRISARIKDAIGIVLDVDENS